MRIDTRIMGVESSATFAIPAQGLIPTLRLYLLCQHNIVWQVNYKSLLVISVILLCLLPSYLQAADQFINTNSEVNRFDNQDKHEINIAKAITIIKQGNTLYDNKSYPEAIIQYEESLKYLSPTDTKSQQYIARVYTKIAESHKRMQNREQTAYFYSKALNVYSNLDDKKHQARTLNTLAEAERYLGNLVLALNYSNRSIKMHKSIDDPEGYAKALMGAGIIYRNIGRYEKSLEHIHQAHLYFQEKNDVKGIAKTSIQIGLIYTKLKQYSLARSFYLRVIELPNEEVPATTLASALRELAVIDLEAKRYNSALIMAEKAHSIYQQENDKVKMSLTARIIANIYREQKNYGQAIQYYRLSLTIATAIDSKIYQIKALTPLAACLIHKDSDEAINLLNKSLLLAKEINDKTQLLYAYRTLRQTEEVRQNYATSLQYAKKEIALAKVIQKENDDNNLVLAKANVYSHKLEADLTSLRKQLALEQLELAKKKNEIEIAQQARKINDLELIKNKYSNLALIFLLAICSLVVLFIYRQFSLSKKRNKELNYLASRDPLTNCYNRRSLFEFMEQYFSQSDANDECCIIMVDIDHFKNINDTYGHNAGDTVIKGVANILQSCIRKNDIVARIGGEEFCIILHRVSQDQAMAIAESMRDKVERSSYNDILVTSSFGVTSLQFGSKNADELIEQADIALYQSKSLGRNKVSLWEQSLQ